MPRDGTAMRERILDAAERLVLSRGFAATSVDAVLSAAAATKGAFFHHFPSRQALAEALVQRYAERDLARLDHLLATVEASQTDPAAQLIALIALLEQAADEAEAAQPGCLFVSFIYERYQADAATHDVIRNTIVAWRQRLLTKLEAAATHQRPALAVDLPSLADQLFTVLEGGFILHRAMAEPGHLRAQLTHLRHYLTLLFPPPDTPASARG